MILQFDIIWPYISGFFNWVSESAGIFVLISGFVALSWLGFERKRRGSFLKRKSDEEKESILSKSMRIILRIISYSGVVVGILGIWAGAMGLILDIPPSFKYGDITPHADHFTCIFLIVVGIAMFFKPVKDLPLTSLLGLIAGSASVFILAILVPDSVKVNIAVWINPKLLLIIIFIIVTALVAIVAKFFIKIPQMISKFLSWPPVAFVIMVFGFVQGILLWGFGISIFANIL
jgi:hypothetical protein